MNHSEMVALIRGGVSSTGRAWADLGAGTGNFTRALRDLLPTDATIYAVDRDARAIAKQHEIAATLVPGATIVPVQADVTTLLALPPLDGVLMANLLHFVRDQPALLSQVHTMITPNGTLLVVEYDAVQRGPWLPYPIGSIRFTPLVVAAGFTEPRVIAMRRSPSSGRVMYAAMAQRPL